jgi:diaminopimelate epimerase
MDLEFTKMHGLGNDFVVIDATRQPFTLSTEQIRHIADRRRGVGCDQLLVVEPSDQENADFRYRIFNADGGEVEQCGNGARCFALYVRAKGLTDKQEISVATNNGMLHLSVDDLDQVRVNMGVPVLDPEKIPFDANAYATQYAINMDGKTIEFGAVSMGNPHAVLDVPAVEHAHVDTLGPAIETHPRFPKRVNVGFMQVVNPKRIRLRVWERGAGETQACGSGACAAVVVGRLQKTLDETVTVELTGGELVVSWAGKQQPVYMTGPASLVFDGTITV